MATINERLNKAVDEWLNPIEGETVQDRGLPPRGIGFEVDPFNPLETGTTFGPGLLKRGAAKAGTVITSGLRKLPTMRSLQLARRELDLEKARKLVLSQRPLPEKIASILSGRNLLKGGLAAAGSTFIITWLIQEIGQMFSIGISTSVKNNDTEGAAFYQELFDDYVRTISPLQAIPIIGTSVAGVKALHRGTGAQVEAGPQNFGRTPEEKFELERAGALGFQRGTAEGQALRAEDEFGTALEARNRTVEEIERTTGLPRREFGTLKGKALLRKEGLAPALGDVEAELTTQTIKKRRAQEKKEEAAAPATPGGVRLEPALEKARQEGRLVPGGGIKLPDTPEVRELLEKIRRGAGKR